MALQGIYKVVVQLDGNVNNESKGGEENTERAGVSDQLCK
jgi:hypothetical protein